MWINGFWAAGFWTSGFWEGDEPVIPPVEGALSPLAIAVQGVGFTPVVLALQGLIAFIQEGGKTSFAGEIELNVEKPKKPWYVKRGKKILVFNTAEQADDFLDAEIKAQEAIEKAQKTSRRARKRLRDKLLPKPQSIDIEQLESLAERYSFNVDLPALVLNQDYERLVAIYQQALEMEEEEIEMLLSLY